MRAERSSRLINLCLCPCPVKVEELGNALPSHVSATKIVNLEITCMEGDDSLQISGKFVEGRFPNRIAVLAEVIESSPTKGTEVTHAFPLGTDVLAADGSFFFKARSVGNTLRQLSEGKDANFRVRFSIFGIDIWDQYQYVADHLIKPNARLIHTNASRTYLVPLIQRGFAPPPEPPKPAGNGLYFL